MKRLILLTLAMLLTAAQAFGADLDNVVRALEAPFQSGAGPGAIADFQADFFQESRLASLDRAQRGRGTVAVKFDRVQKDETPVARFRWDYTQPTDQEIVSDGKTLWVYIPENRQVIESDIEFTAQASPDSPVTFLTGLGNLSRDFNITWGEPNRDREGNWILDLRPRRPSQMIQRMQIVVDRNVVSPGAAGKDRDAFPIRSTRVIDPMDNITHIEFANVRVNRGIPDNRFRFHVPAGVEVIRPTGEQMGF